MKRNQKHHQSKTKPLTRRELTRLMELAGKDQKFSESLQKDFMQAATSQGYYITEQFREKMRTEARKKLAKSMQKRVSRQKKEPELPKGGKWTKIKVKIDRESGESEINFL